jgi:large subunit ribosomal protein L2
MGKRIIVQARGKGSFSYRVRRRAFIYKLKYPSTFQENSRGEVLDLLNSTGHTAPLAKIKLKNEIFYIPACEKMVQGQQIKFNLDEKDKEIKDGDILPLKYLPVKTKVYCIESRPRDGGIFIKTAGNSATITRIIGEEVYILMPSKKEKRFNRECRAIVGIIAGAGRLMKPFVKAGKKHHLKKSKNKLWPRTSAVKMNVIDHPFGSGRGKRNAPAGARVGLIRPRRTGRKKR